MNPSTHRLFRPVLVLLAFALVLLITVGCEEENPVDANTEYLEANLFPISVGHLWVFSTYDLDTTTSQQVPGSARRDVAYVLGTTTKMGKTAFLLIDSVYTSSGALHEIDTTYLAVENDNLLMLHDENTQDVWVTLFDRSAGLNTEFMAGQFQQQEGGFTFTVTFKGKVSPKETITVPIGTVEAYKVELKITVTAASQTYDWVDQTLYFADGYGPVKMTFPVHTEPGWDQKIEGEETILVSKNF